ncbi:MAG: helix-turn-helix domain-containing protein [Butyrivibrio sp.]|nr:helix-turn-helix domain-containing protein [Butyrivibrio sp.]
MNYPVIDTVATGERIKKLRKERHLRAEDISDFMGFTNTQAVYKWQRGESLPTVDNLFALSILFETPMEQILVRRDKDRDESESSLLPINMSFNLF